jgi:zinc protease
MLGEIATYDRPFDFVRDQQETIRNMTLERHRELARQYLDVDHMIYLVVGDAGTQLSQTRGLGLGNPITVDREARPVR